MAEHPAQPSQSESLDSLPRTYSPALLPLYQSLLATVANLDFEHERDMERAKAIPGNGKPKIRAVEQLKERHRERREPYIQQLAILQDRIQRGAKH